MTTDDDRDEEQVRISRRELLILHRHVTAQGKLVDRLMRELRARPAVGGKKVQTTPKR